MILARSMRVNYWQHVGIGYAPGSDYDYWINLRLCMCNLTMNVSMLMQTMNEDQMVQNARNWMATAKDVVFKRGGEDPLILLDLKVPFW